MRRVGAGPNLKEEQFFGVGSSQASGGNGPRASAVGGELPSGAALRSSPGVGSPVRTLPSFPPNPCVFPVEPRGPARDRHRAIASSLLLGLHYAQFLRGEIKRQRPSQPVPRRNTVRMLRAERSVPRPQWEGGTRVGTRRLEAPLVFAARVYFCPSISRGLKIKIRPSNRNNRIKIKRSSRDHV